MSDTVAQAKAALEKAQKLYADAIAAERANALATTKAAIKQFNFTATELGLKVGKGAKTSRVTPKFANPANPGETWSGRGRKPGWVATFLANGGDLEKTRV